MDQTWIPQVTIFYLGRLWQDINLTRLTCVTYPAGRSAYNPIEHAWSPLSNQLTGVTLPAVLVGEEIPPCKQSSLTKEELNKKNLTMLDIATNTLVKYWENVTYDGCAVVPVVVTSKEEERSYNDHDKIDRFLHATLKALKEDKELIVINNEFKFLCKHIDRRSNFVSFMKCQLFRPGRECWLVFEKSSKIRACIESWNQDGWILVWSNAICRSPRPLYDLSGDGSGKEVQSPRGSFQNWEMLNLPQLVVFKQNRTEAASQTASPPHALGEYQDDCQSN